MLKTLARTTPLVKAVFQTKVIAVCVLLDLRADIAIKVKSTSYIFNKSSFTMQEKNALYTNFILFRPNICGDGVL